MMGDEVDPANPRPWEDESRCKLPRLVVLASMLFPAIGGTIACDGCNHNRSECGGRPRRTDAYERGLAEGKHPQEPRCARCGRVDCLKRALPCFDLDAENARVEAASGWSAS